MASCYIDKEQKEIIVSLIRRYRLKKRGLRYILMTGTSRRYKDLFVAPMDDLEDLSPVIVAGMPIQDNH